jgi:methionyl-tRNA synthetase
VALFNREAGSSVGGRGDDRMVKHTGENYYISTAIAYASGKPHIGNTYEIVLADSIARFRRMQGYQVYFQTGTDEHGQKIENKAEEKGCTPQQYVDDVAAEIHRIWDLMNTSYDKFIRTTDAYHVRQVQKIFKKFYEQGDIYKGHYEGWYCTPCESFWTDSQLVDGKCPDCGRPVTRAKEEAYFFRMSKYAPRLIEYINEHPEFIQPVSRKNEMMNNFLLPGLQDLCVSRTSFKWGIPVDFDDKHVVYVWLDALANYITGLGYDADGNSSEEYKKFWPADLHLVGKDIIRFHTIYWPIFLMALGEPLPKQVFGHPWLIQADGKMSKSKGNVIYADDLVSLFGVDAVRYFVLHEMPFENDGVISWELMVERLNSDLANTLGNLVNRTISMSNKYFGGIVENRNADEPVDDDLKAVVTATAGRVEEKMKGLHVADSITEIFALFKRCNKYIDETMPWALAKDEAKKDRLATVLYNLAESITIGASLLEPYMPETTERILSQLNTKKRDYADADKFGLYESGTKVTDKPEILFARQDLKDVMEKVEEIRAKQKGASGEAASAESGKTDDASAKAGEEKQEIHIEPKDEITYDDFAKMQFAVGEVLECREVPKSKKLLVSQIKFGDQTRQIVSGIKKWYKPEEMVGKKVMCLINLKPAKLAGLESQGMILAAEDSEGNVTLMTPEKDMPSGAGIS